MMNKRKNNCGFTLLELVISVSVLVILTGVTAPVFTKYIEKAREQRYITEAKSVFRALQFYLMDLDAVSYTHLDVYKRQHGIAVV